MSDKEGEVTSNNEQAQAENEVPAKTEEKPESKLSYKSGVFIPSALRKLQEEKDINPFLHMSNGDGQGVLEEESSQPESLTPVPNDSAPTEEHPAQATESEEGSKGEGAAGGAAGDTATEEEEEEDEDAKIRLVPNAPHEGKRVYDTAFLLSFKSICKEKPEGLPDLDITKDPQKRALQSSDRGRGWNGRGSGRGSRSRGGGKNKMVAVPKASVPIPPPDEKTWQPSRRIGTSEGSAALKKKVKFILNKLTLVTFEPLSQELLELVKSNVTDVGGFTCVIRQVFDKALGEPQFSHMYAELCLKLQKTCPTFEEDGKKMNFRRILLNECQQEFENKEANQKKLEALSAEAKTEEEMKLRNRVLNNVVFIGELFKLRMLTDKIMHGGVIKVLLNDNPTQLDLEAVCKLFSTIGKLLEDKSQVGGQQVMDQYFKRLRGIQNDEQYPSRIRFMIGDVIDLRSNRWQEGKDDKPKSREQQKKAEKDRRSSSPPRQREAGRGGTQPRRAASSNSVATAAGRKEQPAAAAPKGQGEWEVVGGGKQGQRPARRGDNKPESGRGGKGGGGRDRKPQPQQQQQQQRRPEGGRGTDNSRAGAKKAPSNSSSQPSSGRRPQEKETNNKKPSEPTTSANPFSLLMGGEEVEERSDKKRGNNKPAQGLYVPSHRRQKAPPANDKLEDVELVVPSPGGTSEEESPYKKVDSEIVMLLEEYLYSHDEQEAAECLKELDAGVRHHLVIVKGIEMSLEKREVDREKISDLFGFFKSEGLLTELQASTGFEEVLEKVPSLDLDAAPNSSKYVGVFLGKAALAGVIPLQFLNRALVPLVPSGKALVIATEALATIAQNTAPEEFQKLYQEAKIDLLQFVKEENRNAEFLNSIMEGIKVRGSGLSTLLVS